MTHRSEEYLAHSRSETGHKDPVWCHLQDVANRAAGYAAAFGASDEARLAGLLHDLGKYGALFQRRLEGKERGIDHWSSGAWVALNEYELHQGIAATLAIQGHHIGLQQAAENALKALDPEKWEKNHPDGPWLSEVDTGLLIQRLNADGLELPDSSFVSLYDWQKAPHAAAMLDVRMLFSALVDADFIETEAHFQAECEVSKSYRQPGPALQPERDLSVLTSYLNDLANQSDAASPVRQLRSDLLQACMEAATSPQGLFTLTAPTGAGKTLSMLAFALKHAAAHQLRRVVVVIPYLSIIEQTVREYQNAFAAVGDTLAEYILENHSLAGTRGVDKDQRDEDEAQDQTRLLAENWDAPIIVTTSVQFLESLFANRPAACRKLHRLARSVILFDEVQTLRLSLAVPTLATLSRLVERYGCTVVFSTATQPAFTHLDEPVREYCTRGWRPREIVPESLKLFEQAKRTQVRWPSDISCPTPWAELADDIAARDQALCIVNLKRHALALVEELNAHNAEGVFHLSTNMCPAHRQVVLEEVRERLKKTGSACRLVSTQCVEAGVDVDFPVVFRAFGPLDAIAQAAGRCNRNGQAEVGIVHLFLPEEEASRSLYPDGAYQQAASVTRILLKKYGAPGMDIDNTQLFEEYYRELYTLGDLANAETELLKAIRRQDFVEVGQRYRVIDTDAINVLVPYDLAAFKALADEVRETGLTRKWIAKARPHTVGFFRPRHNDPVQSYLDPVPVGRRRDSSEEWFIYLREEDYDPLLGLVPPSPTQCLIA